MIKSVWKPISKNSEISHYELVDKETLLIKKGTTGYKTIWICDNPNCRTPNKFHSINASHLTKEKMCYNTQICRSCQCTGKGNGRYGDKRKWSDFLSEERLVELTTQFSNKWKGELNPSKTDIIKIKKNQIIINYDSINKICNDKHFQLINLITLDGKRSKFRVQCKDGHISDKSYSSFTRNEKKWICSRCYYNSLGSNLSEDDILRLENYTKQVRILTAKTYKLHKSIINPNNFINGKSDYHIDHKYSIYEGFINKIDTKIISSKENLQMLSYIDNLRKGVKSSIDINDLLSNTKYLL
jgi:hypothetical protein